ncbi:hypothetical protein ACGFIJ_34110 [Microbispora bryophytorum]|uniref:hypothetical protein n=1 Tax=Microbispora bryophytorum TaxID=1460882 RepID=UPI0037138EED
MRDRAAQQLGDISLGQLAALAPGLAHHVGQRRGDLVDLAPHVEQRPARQDEAVFRGRHPGHTCGGRQQSVVGGDVDQPVRMAAADTELDGRVLTSGGMSERDPGPALKGPAHPLGQHRPRALNGRDRLADLRGQRASLLTVQRDGRC